MEEKSHRRVPFRTAGILVLLGSCCSICCIGCNTIRQSAGGTPIYEPEVSEYITFLHLNSYPEGPGWIRWKNAIGFTYQDTSIYCFFNEGNAVLRVFWSDLNEGQYFFDGTWRDASRAWRKGPTVRGVETTVYSEELTSALEKIATRVADRSKETERLSKAMVERANGSEAADVWNPSKFRSYGEVKIYGGPWRRFSFGYFDARPETERFWKFIDLGSFVAHASLNLGGVGVVEAQMISERWPEHTVNGVLAMDLRKSNGLLRDLREEQFLDFIISWANADDEQ